MRLLNVRSLSDRDFREILSFLRGGGVIGYPTETAYGLGADAFNPDAVREIFRIKGRPEDKPIPLIVDSTAMLGGVAAVPDGLERIARRFWPGPLTVVLRALECVPEAVTAGTGTVGARWPSSSFALRLVAAFGTPLTATSANFSGLPAAVTAAEVQSQLEGRLEVLIDGGTLPARGGSTVLDLTAHPPVLLREGPIAFETLDAFFDGGIRRS
jgi:L-threonylcarbamoyladenylate synthase